MTEEPVNGFLPGIPQAVAQMDGAVWYCGTACGGGRFGGREIGSAEFLPSRTRVRASCGTPDVGESLATVLGNRGTCSSESTDGYQRSPDCHRTDCRRPDR